jgi:hypothetical protein
MKTRANRFMKSYPMTGSRSHAATLAMTGGTCIARAVHAT